MSKHAVHYSEQATSVLTPSVADSGIPFVVGTAPVHMASSPAKVGVPVLITRYSEAVKFFGYSDNWDSYTLCEFIYSHFKLFACSPVILCNVLDITKAKKAEAEKEYSVLDHKAEISEDAITTENLTVKSGADTLTKDVDFAVIYDSGKCIIELIDGGKAFDAKTLTIGFNAVDVSVIEDSDIAGGFEAAELCFTSFGVIPDLICCPKYSEKSEIAAVMVAKAGNINGLFKAKALCDIPCADGEHLTAIASKKNANLVSRDMIVCWPKCKLGEKVFHLSTQLAGLMAKVDTENGGIPYESPSNKNLQIDSLCDDSGNEIILTHAKANILNDNGIVTALNFIGGFVAWGNSTACYPANTDVKDNHIPIGRMFSFVGTSLIKTFWSKLDKPMTRRLIDSILDSANIWLNGLVSRGYLLGARVVMLDAENPVTDLMAGIVRLHIYLTPPSATQEIEFTLEYDASYVSSVFAA